jgi:hypothetical protein
MYACVRKLGANDVGSTQHLNAVIAEHDRVEEIEFTFARLIDNATSKTAVKGENHSVADGHRRLRLLKNDGQSPCGVSELAGKMHGEGPHDFYPILILPALGTIEGVLGCLSKGIERALSSHQIVHCATLSFKDRTGQSIMNLLHQVNLYGVT